MTKITFAIYISLLNIEFDRDVDIKITFHLTVVITIYN